MATKVIRKPREVIQQNVRWTVKLAGFSEVQLAAQAAADGLEKDIRGELKAAVGPIVAQAKERFESLPGPAHYVAPTVKGGATLTSVYVQFGGVGGKQAGSEFGSEFGAGSKARVERYMSEGRSVTRTVNLQKTFGRWAGTNGKAFWPAVRGGRRQAVGAITAVLERYVDQLADTGV